MKCREFARPMQTSWKESTRGAQPHLNKGNVEMRALRDDLGLNAASELIEYDCSLAAIDCAWGLGGLKDKLRNQRSAQCGCGVRRFLILPMSGMGAAEKHQEHFRPRNESIYNTCIQARIDHRAHKAQAERHARQFIGHDESDGSESGGVVAERTRATRSLFVLSAGLPAATFSKPNAARTFRNLFSPRTTARSLLRLLLLAQHRKRWYDWDGISPRCFGTSALIMSYV